MDATCPWYDSKDKLKQLSEANPDETDRSDPGSESSWILIQPDQTTHPDIMLVDSAYGPVPCVCCREDPKDKNGLFTHSLNLLWLLGCYYPREEDWYDDVSARRSLEAEGPPWSTPHDVDGMLHITATDPRFAGVRAIGVGTSFTKRQRAARLALAVSVFELYPTSCTREPPDHSKDGSFAKMVSAFRERGKPSEGQSCNCNRSVDQHTDDCKLCARDHALPHRP